MTRNEIVQKLKLASQEIEVVLTSLTEGGTDPEETIGEDLKCFENLLKTDFGNVMEELLDKYGTETYENFWEKLKKEN